MPHNTALPGVSRDSSSDNESEVGSPLDFGDEEVKVALLTPTSESNLSFSYRDLDKIPKTSMRPHPTFARQFSVRSRTHDFTVTNYGPESVDKSPPTPLKTHRTRHLSEPTSPASRATEITTLDTVLDIPDEPERLNHSFPQTAPVKSVRLVVDEPDEADSTVPVIRSINNKPGRWFDRNILDIARRGRAYAKRKKDRLVNKNGECRIVYAKVKKRGIQFLIDFFTTMLEVQWRYHFLLFAVAFGLSWMFFALVWWGIAAADRKINLESSARNGTISEYVPCVIGVTDFSTALLFSIETQHTIGYGTRAITPSCPLATGILMFQSMYGVILQCILTGLIFAKLARPKRRAQTILFSDKAVICNRDGERYLMFRVGDMRRSQILGAKIEVMLAQRRVTKEGENLPIVTQDLPVTTESGSEFIFLAWPIVIMHKIDETSPIWDLSAPDLLEKDWELIVVLEGVDEVTGSSFQVRTSYLPSEILWGHTLKSLLSKSAGGIYTIDYTHFHETDPTNLSEWSARRESLHMNLHPEFDTDGMVSPEIRINGEAFDMNSKINV